MISYYRLRELLSYDPLVGEFKWAVSHGFKKHGTKTSKGRITVDGKVYQAGKLAWFYMHCRWPSKQFRYVDGNRENIKADNLVDGPLSITKPKCKLDHWVRMTRMENGYKLEITQKHKAPVDLGTYPTYEQAAQVQRMALS